MVVKELKYNDFVLVDERTIDPEQDVQQEQKEDDRNQALIEINPKEDEQEDNQNINIVREVNNCEETLYFVETPRKQVEEWPEEEEEN